MVPSVQTVVIYENTATDNDGLGTWKIDIDISKAQANLQRRVV